MTSDLFDRINVRDDYDAFLRAKITPGVRFDGDYALVPRWSSASASIAREVASHAPHLHEYQRFAVTFCVAKRRAAVFAECGLGKTSIALAWLQHVATGPAMVCAPLAAQHEFQNERDKFFPDMDLRVLRTGDVGTWLERPEGVALVTHHAFIDERDLRGLSAFVLDESSILKSGDGRIATGLVTSCRPIQFRLALSATPAPNDPSEYATHATWLGYMRSDAEFRARFFIHDGKDWRPKRHAAVELPRWLSRFALWMRDPAVYGMPCAKALPEPYDLTIDKIETPDNARDMVKRNLLNEPDGVMTMSERAQIRSALYADDARDALTVQLAFGQPTIIWAIRNAHADRIERIVRDAGLRVAQISGATDDEARMAAVNDFQSGRLDVLVSKPKVIGHGVNLQRADRMVFSAYDESYEALHQAIRRSHRQGRHGKLDVHLLATPDEMSIIDALKEKGQRWAAEAHRQECEFARALSSDVRAYKEGTEMVVVHEESDRMGDVVSKYYTLINGDCVAEMANLDADSMDLAVFSPPFASLYTYSSEQQDMGNCSSHDGVEFNLHFHHFARALLRVMKPGRNVCLHLAQLTYCKSLTGRKGLRDFRGTIISAMENAGFWFFGEFVIPKNPQAQAIRTKTDRLQFTSLRRNSLECSPSLNDYVLEFRKPGDAAVAVKPDITNDEWISWASGVWGDIRETDVLEGWMGARGEADEKHICPLQLPVIDRCIRLWSNKGERVFTPFLGIGSEAFQAIRNERIGIGIELKHEYFSQAVRNCEKAVALTHGQMTLFDAA
jgi:superfamily II DNA or RNA helicase/DNA modification methylase